MTLRQLFIKRDSISAPHNSRCGIVLGSSFNGAIRGLAHRRFGCLFPCRSDDTTYTHAP